MKILVDADACPVKGIIEKVAKQNNIKVIMVIDTSHELKSDYSEIITIGKGKDAVDIALINITEKGDIVVTQDYGVATMALAKKAFAISQNGLIYNDNNIESLLFERHMSQRARRGGARAGKIKKRSAEDDKKFEQSLKILLCPN